MSNLSLAVGGPTIADRAFPGALVTDVVLVAAGVALVALAAQLYVPLWPVPISGQTLAVLLVGTTLGASRGALSMVLYPLLAEHRSAFRPQCDTPNPVAPDRGVSHFQPESGTA
jgi:biotin transport system substrate-specific component